MDKILADLEDFELPAIDFEPERDKYTIDKIGEVLVDLNDFCNKYDDSTEKLRTRFTQYFNRLCRENKINIKKTDMILAYQKSLKWFYG